jgi:hypothetical protein
MKPDPEIEKLLEQVKEKIGLPGMIVGIVALYVLSRPTSAPAWTKGLPPLGGRRNGAWRGKGSFGRAPFGSQVKHR